jgi:RNA polymerase sigma factor (sigma-70 family)
VLDEWADDALWRGVAARNTRALEALIARYSREIALFIRVILEGVGTLQDVEECVSDLFIAAWEEIESYDPARGAFRTWLTMRAKYLALDRRRHIQRRQALASVVPGQTHDRDGQAGDTTADFAANAAAAGESMDHLLERREQQEQVRRALEQLPELDRLLVYMRYFRLDTTEEIAARTGLTRRAIDTRLWRARKMLRDALGASEQSAPDHSSAGAPTEPAKDHSSR